MTVQQSKDRQFTVEGAKRSPFLRSKASPKGPSGSTWGLQHLNWLNLHFAVDYEPQELFSSQSELPESSEIVANLQQELGADWAYICNTKHPKALSIYAIFQRLIHERREDDEYKTATQTSTHPSSSSSPGLQSLRSSASPQQSSQSAKSRQERETTPIKPHVGLISQPSTPGLIGRKRPLETTPSPQGQHGKTTPPSRQRREGSAASNVSTPRGQMIHDEDERGAAYESALLEVVPDDEMRRLIEDEEEAEKAAQDYILHEEELETDPGLPSEAASGDKSEKVVENVGWAFLDVVQGAMKATANHGDVNQEMLDAQGLKIIVRNSDVAIIRIDGIPMSAEPDSSLFCTFGKAGYMKTISVVVEYKKRDHKRSPTGILGQECAELLGLVCQEKEFQDKVAKAGNKKIASQKRYTSYLISWHGLMAYVSRLDTTHGYLEQLNQKSTHVQKMEPPRIKRSRLLNLTKTQDRIDLATIAARIAIEQLSQYNRNRVSGLVARLMVRHEQRGEEGSSVSGESAAGEKAVRRGLRDRLCGDCKLVFDSYE